MEGLVYNTARPTMRISEYGRGIQKMINHLLTIEDRNERNRAARSVITSMAALTPSFRDYDDFKQKLWDHLFLMSNFKLDVDSPYPIPTAETIGIRPKKPLYPSQKIKYKHYGKIMENMVGKVSEWEQGDVRDMVVESIANQLKKSYIAWNRDSVQDDVIIDHLTAISNGKLKLSEHSRISQNLPMKADEFDKNGGRGGFNKNKKNNKYKKRF